jgi:hypothetical protein
MVCAPQFASKDSSTSSGRLQLGDLPFQYGDVLAQLASDARAQVGIRQALLNADEFGALFASIFCSSVMAGGYLSDPRMAPPHAVQSLFA